MEIAMAWRLEGGTGKLWETEFSSYVPNLNFWWRYLYVLYNENLVILKAFWANITYVHLCSIVSSSIYKSILYIQHQLNDWSDLKQLSGYHKVDLSSVLH